MVWYGTVRSLVYAVYARILYAACTVARLKLVQPSTATVAMGENIEREAHTRRVHGRPFFEGGAPAYSLRTQRALPYYFYRLPRIQDLMSCTASINIPRFNVSTI